MNVNIELSSKHVLPLLGLALGTYIAYQCTKSYWDDPAPSRKSRQVDTRPLDLVYATVRQQHKDTQQQQRDRSLPPVDEEDGASGDDGASEALSAESTATMLSEEELRLYKLHEEYLVVEEPTSPKDEGGVSALFRKITAGKMPTRYVNLEVEDTTSVRGALRRLLDHKTLCAPVVKHHPDVGRVYTGLISVMSAARAIVASELRPLGDPIASYPAILTLAAVSSGSWMTEVVNRLKEGSRHVAIVDDKTQTVKNMVSQGDVLRFMMSNRSLAEFESLRDALDRTLADLNLGRSPRELITVPSTTTARKAIETMLQNGITSLPIVRAKNRIVGVVSLSDIKVLAQEALSHAQITELLDLPVPEFVERSRAFVRTGVTPSVVSAHRTDALVAVLQKMNQHRIHHLYLTDPKSGTPPAVTGVVSFIDILRVLV